MTQVPGDGVSGRSYELDQLLVSLFAPTHVGHNCDPGVRDTALPLMTQIILVCRAEGSKCQAPINRPILTGGLV